MSIGTVRLETQGGNARGIVDRWVFEPDPCKNGGKLILTLSSFVTRYPKTDIERIVTELVDAIKAEMSNG